MAISKETQAQINMARKDGYSDAEIFAHLKNSPKYKNRFTMAKKDGYSEGDIAQQLDSPPHRRLRKRLTVNGGKSLDSPPHRRLRKLLT